MTVHLSDVIVFTDGTHIYTIKPDGTGLAAISGAGTGWRWAVATPDGSQIVAYGTPGLTLMAADGSGQSAITNMNTNWPTSGGDAPPTFSPDGTRFVTTYSHVPFGFPEGVQIVNLDNSGHTDIPLADISAGFNTVPYWSPDGTKLAFPSSPGGHYDGVSVCNIDGSGEVTLLTGTALVQYDVYGWYADGVNLLVNKTAAAGSPIDVLKTDGSSSTVLYSDPTDVHFGDWCQALSPDGTEVVLFDDTTGGLSVLSGGVVSGLLTPPPIVNVSSVQWLPVFIPPVATIAAGAQDSGIIRRGTLDGA